MSFLFRSPGDMKVAGAILAMVIFLGMLPLVLMQADFRYLFSEKGPFERISIFAWIFVALIIVWRIRPLGIRAWAFVSLFILFAAREGDLDRVFTGPSMLTLNYYKRAVAPFSEKLMAGIVAFIMFGLIIYAGIVIFRFLFLRGGWRSRTGFWLMFSATLIVFCSVIDRMPAVLAEDYGIVLSPLARFYVAAYEEGLEMINPLILAWSIWISQDERPYLS